MMTRKQAKFAIYFGYVLTVAGAMFIHPGLAMMVLGVTTLVLAYKS